MITKIILKNFKCFKEETTFPLTHFNLLTGINGRGKSTLLQSLLVMHQSGYAKKLVLNGSHINLGRFEDVKNYEIPASEPITMDFHKHFNQPKPLYVIRAKYNFTENKSDNRSADISSIELSKYNDKSYIYQEDAMTSSDTLIAFEHLFLYIHYISADRIGPQEFYLKYTPSSIAPFTHVGVKGEHLANILLKMREHIVHDFLHIKKRGGDSKVDISQDMLTQTGEWLNFIFEGASVKIEDTESAIINLFFNTTGRSQDNHNKPSNVGFGFSHTLPIIVAGLQAANHEILIVENPEAHLHPRAQSRLTTFLTKVAKTGVQVYVETHSDHILNASRVAVLDEILEPDELNILYFQSNKKEQVVKIPVDKKGGIDTWPDGFFDQTDKDYKRLFGF